MITSTFFVQVIPASEFTEECVFVFVFAREGEVDEVKLSEKYDLNQVVYIF